MTSRQAIHESIRRWTRARAFAYEEPCALAEERFQVGYSDGWRDIIRGFGATWEEAFGLADQTLIDTSEESGGGRIRMASSKDTAVGAALAQAVHVARSGGLMRRRRSKPKDG